MVVLPLGLGIVFGILLLNSYGRYVVRRRAIEGGLILLGLLLGLLTVAGPISRAVNAVDRSNQIENLSGLTSLVAVVVVIAFFAGIAYGIVAISSQTQLQEDLPEAVRGRVFGVLNMLVSVASFVPIIVVGPIADFVGTTNVILTVAALILVPGIVSVVLRGPVAPDEAAETPGRWSRAGRWTHRRDGPPPRRAEPPARPRPTPRTGGATATWAGTDAPPEARGVARGARRGVRGGAGPAEGRGARHSGTRGARSPSASWSAGSSAGSRLPRRAGASAPLAVGAGARRRGRGARSPAPAAVPRSRPPGRRRLDPDRRRPATFSVVVAGRDEAAVLPRLVG